MTLRPDGFDAHGQLASDILCLGYNGQDRKV
jgi:hypothetical protein